MKSRGISGCSISLGRVPYHYLCWTFFSLPELLFSPLAQKISARFRTISSIKIQHTWSKGFRGRRSIPVVGVNSKSPHQNI